MLVSRDPETGPGLVQERRGPGREGRQGQRHPDVVQRPGRPERAQDVVVDLREAHGVGRYASRFTFFR